MRILIATDAFPPVAGGSGWSTYELARGLRARGHHLVIVQPFSKTRPAGYDGFRVIGFRVMAPDVPFLKNYFRNERLYRRLSTFLGRLIRAERIDLIHAQHELTGPASVRAAKNAGIPSVCTVRDYWPLCYWSDLVRDPRAGDLCPACSISGMTRCLPPRVGPAWVLTTPFIAYMRANLRQKQHWLGASDAVVAVSSKVGEFLKVRSHELANARIEVIPNCVDIADLRRRAGSMTPPMDGEYALFVGKLARNKGAVSLIDIAERARLALPLVVIGDGPERTRLTEAAARLHRDIRILDWLDHDEVLRWLKYTSVLIFPSNWPEPLSRVLLEASALGTAIAAMDTGGTADVIVDEQTGLLAHSVDGVARNVARLASSRDLRHRLGVNAAQRAEERFDASKVLDRIEGLYADVVVHRRSSIVQRLENRPPGRSTMDDRRSTIESE
jgi:glycosyltransferase involved in cell wall biosynthesis